MVTFLILGNDHTGVADDKIVALFSEHHFDALERVVQQSGQLLFMQDELCHLCLVQVVAGEQILLSGDIQLILLQVLGHFADALYQWAEGHHVGSHGGHHLIQLFFGQIRDRNALQVLFHKVFEEIHVFMGQIKL